MYVRLITFHVKPGVTADRAAAVYDALFARMRAYRGFRGMSGLMNAAAGQAISLSYWQDEACAAEAGEQSLPLLMEQVQELVDRPPEISGYEVVKQDLLPD